jgi:hypothetical protein
MSGRPRRLAAFPYRGIQRYSLTFCSHGRRRVFTSPKPVEDALAQITQAAATQAFDILAYSFMPDIYTC